VCVCDLFHILLSFWQSFGSMKCVHVCVYTGSFGNSVCGDSLDSVGSRFGNSEVLIVLAWESGAG
jgi:hypothetical protein